MTLPPRFAFATGMDRVFRARALRHLKALLRDGEQMTSAFAALVQGDMHSKARTRRTRGWRETTRILVGRRLRGSIDAHDFRTGATQTQIPTPHPTRQRKRCCVHRGKCHACPTTSLCPGARIGPRNPIASRKPSISCGNSRSAITSYSYASYSYGDACYGPNRYAHDTRLLCEVGYGYFAYRSRHE